MTTRMTWRWCPPRTRCSPASERRTPRCGALCPPSPSTTRTHSSTSSRGSLSTWRRSRARRARSRARCGRACPRFTRRRRRASPWCRGQCARRGRRGCGAPRCCRTPGPSSSRYLTRSSSCPSSAPPPLSPHSTRGNQSEKWTRKHKKVWPVAHSTDFACVALHLRDCDGDWEAIHNISVVKIANCGLVSVTISYFQKLSLHFAARPKMSPFPRTMWPYWVRMRGGWPGRPPPPPPPPCSWASSRSWVCSPGIVMGSPYSSPQPPRARRPLPRLRRPGPTRARPRPGAGTVPATTAGRLSCRRDRW